MSANRCIRCGHDRPETARLCKNCGTEYWCDWSPDWYIGRLTRLTIGHDATGKRLATKFTWFSSLLLLLALILQVFVSGRGGNDHAVWPLAMLAAVYATYQIRNFFYGRVISFGYASCEKTPQGTLCRTFMLTANLVLFGFSIYGSFDLR